MTTDISPDLAPNSAGGVDPSCAERDEVRRLAFELNPNPSQLGAPIDAFGHTGAGGSTHGAWPSLQTSFSYTMREFQLESQDVRAAQLLAALHSC